jgi:hypothetical protein|tara:strand:+ start:85 stop:252 length:168 start_codon:yes stop_codon:yes gene_type:complete
VSWLTRGLGAFGGLLIVYLALMFGASATGITQISLRKFVAGRQLAFYKAKSAGGA